MTAQQNTAFVIRLGSPPADLIRSIVTCLVSKMWLDPGKTDGKNRRKKKKKTGEKKGLSQARLAAHRPFIRRASKALSTGLKNIYLPRALCAVIRILKFFHLILGTIANCVWEVGPRPQPTKVSEEASRKCGEGWERPSFKNGRM